MTDRPMPPGVRAGMTGSTDAVKHSSLGDELAERFRNAGRIGPIVLAPEPATVTHLLPPEIPPVARMDLTPFLPDGWQHDLVLASEQARQVQRLGGGPGSLHLGAAAGLDYRTLARDELLDGPAAWLGALHEQVVSRLLRLATGLDALEPIVEPHGLSMNVVGPDSAIGGGYEWHVDGADHVYVCVLTPLSWDSGRGGRFLWHTGSVVFREDLKPGEALALRSSTHPHAVERPLSERVSVLLAYTLPGATRERGLSAWLGQTTTTTNPAGPTHSQRVTFGTPAIAPLETSDNRDGVR